MATRGQPCGTDFEDTYRAHRVDLLRLAYLLSGSREVSEDVVQSAFTSAHERWHAIDKPLPYLKRAVVNLVRDAQRRHFRFLAHPPEQPAVVLPPEVDETWTHLTRLPWAQRAVIVLRYYEDLPLTEVATVLDRPEATVRSDHRRGLDRRRKALT